MPVRRRIGSIGLMLLGLFLLPGPVMAGEPAPRLEFGPTAGIVPSAGRPGLRMAYFGGGHLAVRVTQRLWLEMDGGAAPTSSTFDPRFTVNLFFIHTALKMDLIRHLTGPLTNVPFITLGVSYLDFDPSGAVDAENDLRRWSADCGGGVTVPIRRHVGVQIAARFSVMTTRVERFPVATHQGSSRVALQGYIGTALVARL